MAGSYGHVNFIDGKWSLVVNMGDAFETTEELLWLAGTLARHILRQQALVAVIPPNEITLKEIDEFLRRLLQDIYYPTARREREADDVFLATNRVMARQL